MIAQETSTLFEEGHGWTSMTVVVPLYNYEKYITQTLESVASQTLEDLCLVVVDDCSTDSSAAVVRDWMHKNRSRFRHVKLAQNVANAGLAITRNTGISITESECIFFLDADNLIYPRCLMRLLHALEASPQAQGAYSLLEVFGAEQGLIGTEVFNRDRLRHGNYIDAMALIRRQFLIRSAGYHDIKFGWEDFDLWLRMCEEGDFIIQVPEILGRYRVHGQSMLRTTTNVGTNHLKLKANIKALHPWVDLH